ncbi:MAG: aspartate/glutamate racemase family protein [Ignavibacteriales bacterium]|nr:aspartate/glutamate racemase family protein [Ignavibacteriales bacterium]
MRLQITSYILTIASFGFFLCGVSLAKNNEKITNNSDSLNSKLEKLLKKENIKIIITDSGLGGLSVVSDIENKLAAFKPFKEVELIFFNSLADHQTGYNSMPNNESKVRVFNSALESMERLYHPDLILIACNTLSVVYPNTEFSQTTKIPVFGIVDIGVDLMYKNLQNDLNSSIIILGTPTTISSESHKKKLVSKNIPEDRIVTQACRNLESEIQNDPKSNAVRNMIELYSDEAKAKMINTKSKISVGLCCTHYGYSIEVFEDIMKKKFGSDVTIINPNSYMSEFIIKDKNKSRFNSIITKVEVVSQADISDQEIESLGSLLKINSLKTAEALKNYNFKKNLFEYRNLIY